MNTYMVSAAPPSRTHPVSNPIVSAKPTPAQPVWITILTAVFQQSGDWWAAWVEELPGANAQGRTLEEARVNLREAAQLMLEEGEVPEEAHEVLAPDAFRESLNVLA